MSVVATRRKRSESKPGLVGVNLRRLRDLKHIGQEEIAAAAGLHRITISNIETGFQGDVEVETLLKLAEAIGVRPEELLEQPQQLAPVEPLIKLFLASPHAAVLRPTPEEIAWLRSRPGAFWFGIEPTPAVLAKAVEMRREELRK